MADYTGTKGDDSFIGTADRDEFHLLAGGSDTALGGAGSDLFYMGMSLDGSDHIDGGDDFDLLYLGGDGVDTVEFTATTMTGIEQIELAATGSFVFSGLTDANVGAQLNVNGNQSDGDISIDASAVETGRLYVYTGDGDDLFRGGGGDDAVSAGQGDDSLYGGDGADSLDGSSGNNLIDGQAGDDTLAAGYGDNSIYGGDGDDRLSTSQLGDSLLDGGAGHDYLTLNGADATSRDTLSGGDGDDSIAVFGLFTPDDRVDGGAGQDNLSFFGNEAVRVGGGGLAGIERISLFGHSYRFKGLTDASFGGAATIDADFGEHTSLVLDASGVQSTYLTIVCGTGHNRITGGNGGNTIVGGHGVATIIGGDGADSLIGGSGDDFVRGGKGDDTIAGGVGASDVGGGQGDDVIHLGQGGDTISGGAGNDVIQGILVAGETIDGGSGEDTMQLVGGSAILTSAITGLESIVYHEQFAITVQDGFLAAGQTIVITGIYAKTTGPLTFDASAASAGDFQVRGVNSADTLLGGGGDDRLSGLGRNDLIDGGAGDDRLYGGDGSDIMSGGDGDDRMDGGAPRSRGNDQMSGGAGDDTLLSGGALCTLDGGDGNDMLVARGGYNRMIGGLGQDVFTVDAHASTNTYAFTAIADSTLAAPDLISTLHGGDRIDLTAIDADLGTDGDQAFHLVGSFGGHAGELMLAYDAGSDTTSLMGDVDGDGVADFLVLIAGDQSSFTGFFL